MISGLKGSGVKDLSAYLMEQVCLSENSVDQPKVSLAYTSQNWHLPDYLTRPMR